MSEARKLLDLCNKRMRMYHDLLLGRMSYVDFSNKMNLSLKETDKEYKVMLEAEKIEAEKKVSRKA